MNYKEFSGKIKTKYPQYKSMDDRDLAQRMVQKYPQYSGVTFDEAPGIGQKLAQIGTLPFRGYRGMAVGLENLPKGPSAALQRASEATQTGFKPKGIGETIAAVVGEGAPLMPLGGALGAGGKIAQLVKAGTLGAGLSALTQTAEEGKPTLGRTAFAGALGMAPVGAMQGIKGVFPMLAGKFTKVPAEAYDGLTTMFKKTFPGTAEAVEGAAEKVGPALEAGFGVLNKRLQGRKQFMGMLMSPKEAMAEAEATGGEPRNVSQIVKEFKGIQRRSAPITEKRVPSQLVGPSGKPLTKTVIERGIPKGEKLRRLSDMSIDINKQTGGSYTSDVLGTKQAVEREAMKTGGTSYKIFNKFKQQWGKLKEIESDLGTNLSDPKSAGTEMERLVRKLIEAPKKITGNDARKLDALERLERVTGRQLIEPLRKQLLSQYTNENLSEFVPKGVIGKILLMKYFPEGVASFLLGSPKAMGRVAQTLYNPTGMVGKAAKAATPTLINRTLNQFRGNGQ